MAAIPHARCSLALCLLAGLLAAQAPGGRDWFVRAGATGGDGSRTAPFDDPWRALVLCEAGDRIHLATGQYFGRLGVGTWNIPVERVQLLGGYDPGFTARDPWRRPTQLCWNSTSKNWPLCARLSSDRRDVVVDGLVIDMQDQDNYVTGQRLDRAARLGESAMQFSAPATVRNCVILNPGCRAIDCTVGATIENNLVVNALVWSIAVSGAPAGLDRTTATIRGNTVLFAWDTEKPGAGGYGGAAIALRGPAVVADNVLGHCDNAAIYAVVDPARLSITGNVFWHNRFANLTAEVKGQRAVVDDREMEMMEDVGLAACTGNRVADPAIAIDAKAFAAGFAPACSLELVLRMLRPAGAAEPAGARALALPAPQFASAPPAPARNYQRTTLTSWNGKPASVDGKALEMLVAIGPVANVQSMPAEYAKDAIAGVRLFDPEGSGEMVTGFYPTGSAVDRVCAEATGWYQGSGKPPRLHLVRGIARAVNGVPKAAFFVEAIERCEPPAAPAAAPPPGRDWFVLAGATGGDGTREKPFRDPFQALERCEAGDTIHVASGEYHGKLKAGRWSVGMPFVTLLGGYDATFARRDPWRQPTRLQCTADFQGRRVGYTLEGTDDHTGTVVDGFVFDKRCDNVYDKDGALDVAHSDKIEHVWLSRPGCRVRNCVFLNGASSAMRMAGGQSVRNCVFVNHVVQTVSVEPGHSTDPFEFRDNTVLFVWSNHPGEGHGASGSLLRVGGQAHAVVEHNVFAYADNDAIRIECDPRDVALRANLFAHNLWSNVQHMPTRNTVDDAVIGQLADLDLGACEGNRVAEPALPIDQAWLARYRAARPADAQKPVPPPSKPVPAGNPFDDGAAARAPAPAATSAAANPFGAPAGEPTGGADGKPFAPAYEWQAALELAVATGDVGARRRELPVAFTGITRGQENHDYAATTWAVALRTEAWAGLDGKRVQLEGAIQREDTMFQLDDIRAQDYACYLFSSPDGSGLPLRCYVRRGTKVQRAFEQAKGFATGGPTELHLLRGIARERRQMVVEAVEKTR